MKPILTFIILVSFSIYNFIYSQLLPQENSILFKQTNSVFNKVIEKNNFTNTIPLDSSASLPIGIHKQIGQSTYIIAIDSAKFLPNSATCNAYVLIGLHDKNYLNKTINAHSKIKYLVKSYKCY